MISKQKFLGVCLGAALTITSFGTVFAVEQQAAGKENSNNKQYELKLEEKAKAKGMTVEELKKKIEERKVKFQEEARTKGITVEELRKQKRVERKAKLEKEAKDKGITVKELIKQKKANGKMHR